MLLCGWKGGQLHKMLNQNTTHKKWTLNDKCNVDNTVILAKEKNKLSKCQDFVETY